jgi:TolB-like protein/Tfp pilus assembly protein PilF
MPFVNTGGDPNAEYLTDGITENLINNLSQLPKLRVAPRTVVMRYKGKDADPRAVGRDLNVRAILTGKVVHRGDSLNVQTELVSVADVSQLWGQQYDRRFTEIQAVQEDIARRVAEKLRLRTTGEEQKKLARRYTANTEAYQLYLKGRFYWNRRTTGQLKKANEYFQQAIEKDPSYALAYAGLAESYALSAYYSVQRPAESCPQTKLAANKAIALDSSLVEPYTALGWVKMSCDWDLRGSEAEFRRALEINPKDLTTRGFYAGYLKAVGKLEESIASVRIGLEADPLNMLQNAVLGRDLYLAGHDDEAMQQLKKTIELDPTFVDAHLALGWVYERRAMYAEAIAELQQALTVGRGDPRFESSLGHAYAVAGQRNEAEASLARLTEFGRQNYVAPYDVAVVYAGLKDTEQTFKQLELALQDRSFWMCWLKIDPRFDGVRSDPRYADILRRMNLAP